MIRPTARLKFHVKTEECHDDLIVDLKRCYLNVAPLTIEAFDCENDGQEEGFSCGNELDLIVVLHHSYWDSSQNDADATWSDVLIPWLEKKLYKLNATVQGFAHTRKGGPTDIRYDRLSVVLGNVRCAFKLPDSMEFPEEVPDLLCRCRDLANNGILQGVALSRIDIPFCELVPAEAELNDAVKGDCETVANDGADEGGPEKQKSDARIDYSIWGVRLPSGEVKQLDATAGTWVEA
jgi:hypothetical protein